METKSQNTRVLLLVVALALTGLVVGIWGAYALKRTDALYSDLIDTNTRILSDLQAVTQASANIHRYCLNLLLVENPSELHPLKDKMARAWQENDARLENIRQLSKGQQSEHMANKLKKNRDSYFQAHESFVKLAATSGRNKAFSFKTEVLRPAFEAYQAAQAEMADYVQRSAAKASDAATAHSRSMQKILIGFASWPIIFTFGVIVISVISFIFLFRHLPSD